MKKIIDILVLKIDEIIEKLIPKLRNKINEIVLSKINDKGLLIAYWISSVLSKVFFIHLLVGVIMNFYIYGINVYYKNVNIMISYNWLTNLILDFIIPMLILPIPYMIVRLMTKLIRERLNDEIDQSNVLFATGSFLVLTNFTGLTRIISSITTLIYQMQLGDKIDPMIFVHPSVNTIIPIIYIFIGLKYIKMSNCLRDPIAE
jgi:hypothetical protein